MRIDRKTGLVLEGGGMRGVFTSGVLDAFMKHEVWFPYVVAVSAGACNGVSYMSRQIRRARIANIDLLDNYDYIGLKHLVTQGSIFDRQLLYDEFPNRLVPFDWDTYVSTGSEFEVVTTNCLTGRAEYLSEYEHPQRLNEIIMASSALPYVSSMVNIDGVPMLDGGIVDSIPVQHAIEKGHDFNVVIATRNLGYRSKEHDIKVPPIVYDDYPRLRVALSDSSGASDGSRARGEGPGETGSSLSRRLSARRAFLQESVVRESSLVFFMICRTQNRLCSQWLITMLKEQ